MKNKVISFGIFVFLALISINFISANNMTWVVNPGEVNVNIEYNITVATDSSCSNVLFYKDEIVTTNSRGFALITTEVPNDLDSIPVYTCEYKDGVLRKVHYPNDLILNKLYANNANFSGNVTANKFYGIYNWTENSPLLDFDGSTLSFDYSLLNSSLDNRYYNISNPFSYYNLTDFNINDYLLKTDWNATNTSYYLNSNPFGYYNSSNFDYTTFLTNNTYGNFSDLFIIGDLTVLGTSNLGSIIISANNITTDNILSKTGSGITFFDNLELNNYNITTTGTGFFDYIGLTHDLTALGNIYENGVLLSDTYYSINNPYSFWNDTYATFNKTYADTLYSDIQWNYNQTTPAIDTILGYGYYNSSNFDYTTFLTNNTMAQFTSINVTGNAYIGDLTWNGNLDLGGNDLLNAGWVNSTNGYFSGNVGIGTNNPLSALQVEGDIRLGGGQNLLFGATTEGIREEATSNSIEQFARGQLRFYADTNANSGTDYIAFYTNVAEGTTANPKLYIADDGDVGIETSSPSEKLTIQGTANTNILINSTGADSNVQFILQNDVQDWRIGNRGGVSDKFIIRDHTNSVDVMSIEVGANANSLYIDADGNVGVGTNSPSDLFHVSGSNKAIRITNTADGSGNYWRLVANADNSFSIKDSSDSKISIAGGSGSNNAIKIDSSGKVGIGTSTPLSPLHISSTGSQKLRLQRGTGQIYFQMNSNQDDFWITNSSGSTYLRIDNTGKVGIGTTTPQNKLNVIGSFNQTSGNSYINNIYGGMWFYDETGYAMTLNDTYQTITGFDMANHLNGFTNLTGGKLQLTEASGIYEVHWEIDFSGTNLHTYRGKIFVNNIEQNNTADITIGEATGDINLDGFGFIDLNRNDNVTIRIRDVGDTTSATIYNGNIIIKRVGN